jgi:nicotinamidase-related amidase
MNPMLNRCTSNRSGFRTNRLTIIVVLAVSGALLAVSPPQSERRLTFRSRVEPFKGSGEWEAVTVSHDLDPSKTALVLCDMWDRHWCSGAEERVGVLARKMEPMIQLARKRGVLIIHSPSETMPYYSQTAARIKMVKIAVLQPPEPLPLTDPPLPIDDSDGGCEVANNRLPPNTRVWSRENPAISIANEDLISDNGREIYSALRSHGIDTLLFAGVHTNMCILNRTFGIRQMTRWGVHCVLIRDLTDAMYNPARSPHVSHSRGTELVVEHIEKYWAPTVTSDDLMRVLSAR